MISHEGGGAVGFVIAGMRRIASEHRGLFLFSRVCCVSRHPVRLLSGRFCERVRVRETQQDSVLYQLSIGGVAKAIFSFGVTAQYCSGLGRNSQGFEQYFVCTPTFGGRGWVALMRDHDSVLLSVVTICSFHQT